MPRLLYVAHDQLHREYGVMKGAIPGEDVVVFVESTRQLNNRTWHQQRLFYLLASAQHFAQELELQGFEVHYIKAETTKAGIEQVKNKMKPDVILAVEPSSYRLRESLLGLVNFIPNDFFLTNRNDFLNWASAQKKLLMENFYRIQRQQLNLLMDGDKPMGGSWNYDSENRKAVPKDHSFPEYLEHERDELDLKIVSELKSSSYSMWGDEPDTTWATTRAGALRQLNHFIENHFQDFGPYEDAMTSKNWALHHSLLSPYLNNGLLHASEVIEKAVAKFNTNAIPLSSAEGFIRQIIGWREYVHGLYWFFGESYRDLNFWKHTNPLPALFDDPNRTVMNCLKEVISDVKKRGWVHHIPRLMVLSNFAQLARISPQALLDWMRRVFIDATDWVMVPNVIGMSLNADGGKMMSKPYIAGGGYISKMSDYCGGCRFNPKLRTGEDACPFTTLYWHFIDENFDELRKNHRMSQQIMGIKKLKDLDEVKNRGDFLLEEIRRDNL